VLDVTESNRATTAHRGVETKAFNQRGEEVCYFRRKVMVWKRAAAPPRRRPTTTLGLTSERPGLGALRRAVLAFVRLSARPPWRRTREPWAIL